MNFSAPAQLPAPSIAFHAVKPLKVQAPKLSKVTIKGATNGASVTHHFTAGKPKSFLFTNPTLMTKHIKRAINNAWLNPVGGDVQEAHKIDTALNV
jgi:hypothetical protein